MSKMPSTTAIDFPDAFVKQVVEVLLEAGSIALRYYGKPRSVHLKKINDPVTNVDLEIHDLFLQFIKKNYRDDLLISEEQEQNPSPNTGKRVWVLDPIDGTNEYVNQSGEYCISLAIIESPSLSMGFIYNPTAQELFAGISSPSKKFLWQYDFLQKQLQELTVKERTSKTKLIYISSTEQKHGYFESLMRFTNSYQYIAVGSIAYKLGLLAAQRCDLVVSLRHKNYWDVAGGQALLEAAQMSLVDVHGLAFDPMTKAKIDGVIAGSRQAIDQFMVELRRHELWPLTLHSFE